MYVKNAFIVLFLCRALFAIDYQEARHLLSRTGFGGTPAEIEELLPLSYEEAVHKLLGEMGSAPIVSAPEWTQNTTDIRGRNKFLMKIMSEDQKRQYRMLNRQKRNQKGVQLKIWWYKQMIKSKSPLTERMILFFHNHFTSSLKKVKSPYLIYKQNLLFREYLRGNLRELTQEVAKDPAMILYLDNQTNRKSKPNENFARELLELFTLGEGNYSEKDIKQGARAFTGWMVNKKNASFRFNRNQHDNSEKEFMGKKGDFNGENIIDIIFENRQVARYFITKMWKEFIGAKPNTQEVERLTTIFIDNDYEMMPLFRAFFLSSHFRDPGNYGKQIKSPVEFIVGTVRMFKVNVSNYRQLVQYGRQLGQDLFDPPNVKGWPGGKQWITSNTLLGRRQMLDRALTGTDMFLKRFWVWHYIEKKMSMNSWVGLNSAAQLDKIQAVLLPISPVNPVQKTNTVATIKKLVFDLSYQLK